MTARARLSFATALHSRDLREENLFLPPRWTEERMYAAGKIPGGFFRREGRPSTDGILTARLTDRPLRPLFPKGMRNDVQVVITTLVRRPGERPGHPGGHRRFRRAHHLRHPVRRPDFRHPHRLHRTASTSSTRPTTQRRRERARHRRRRHQGRDRHGRGRRQRGLRGDLLEAHEAAPRKSTLRSSPSRKRCVAQDRQGRSASSQRRPRRRDEDGRRRLRQHPRLGPRRRRQGRARRGLMDAVRNETSSRRSARSTSKADLKAALDEHMKNVVRDSILDDGKRPDGRKPRRDPPDQRRSRPPAADARLRPLHPRRDPGAHRPDARLHGRAAAARRPRAGGVATLHAPLQLPAVLRRRGAAHARRPAAATSATARSPSARCCPVIPGEDEFPYTIRLVSEVLSRTAARRWRASAAARSR